MAQCIEITMNLGKNLNILKKINVLFVEDEQSILEKYSPFLETYCKTLYTAKDGVEAYEIYKEKNPNVILMDLYMPRCTGVELARKIREEDSSVVFIALSAHSDRDTLLDIVDLHFSSYLTKPVNRVELLGALTKSAERINSHMIVVLPLNYSWDTKSRTLFNGDIQIPLTKREQKLFELLVEKEGAACGDAEILYHVWENEFDKHVTNTSIRTLIKNLRKKIPKELIKNQYGVGYKIDW